MNELKKTQQAVERRGAMLAWLMFYEGLSEDESSEAMESDLEALKVSESTPQWVKELL